MKQILLFGAGKSATVLIDYLLAHALEEDWQLTVADADLALAKAKIGSAARGKAVSFDIVDAAKRGEYIQEATIVISMLPPVLHGLVAKDCVKFSRNLLTASYVDDTIRALDNEIEAKGLLFLCEMGLDPGIDHMSAMKIIDHIHAEGGSIVSFKSHCGGIVAPESDDNPWHYKISWNPRNIIMAGKAGAHFIDNGKEINLSHEQLFSENREVEIPGLGKLSWYPNRDSLSYAPLYDLQQTKTLIRTTLRHPDFMSGWSKILQLGFTNETAQYDPTGKTIAELMMEHANKNVAFQTLITDPLFKLQWSWLLGTAGKKMNQAGPVSAADILQAAVEETLALRPQDKDMIVMLHEFEYELAGKRKHISSSLVVKGENSLHTAMAKTVGLPLAMATKLILQGKIKETGLRIPTKKEIYEPVLKELALNGIRFNESSD